MSIIPQQNRLEVSARDAMDRTYTTVSRADKPLGRRVSRRGLVGAGLALGGAAALGAPGEGQALGVTGMSATGPLSSALATQPWGPATAPAALTDSQRRSLFLQLVATSGQRTLHVSGAGSDAAPGTGTAPLRQISAAVAQARPGDLILVGDGVYGYTAVENFTGRPDAWLAIMTETAQTSAVLTVPPPTDNFVNIVASCYVGLYGFEVRGDQDDPNTNGSGISIYGNSHHIAVWNTYIHDFPGGGINCFDVDGSHDMLDIRYNRITRTSRYSPSNTSGISIYAARDLTGGQTFADGYAYRIIGNYIYNVVCVVPFTPGGVNCVTDGNGISLDSIYTRYDYIKPLLVANNVVTGCGGRAIYSFNTLNVDVLFNAAAGNLRVTSPALTGAAELMGNTDTSVRHVGNTICPTNTLTTSDSRSLYVANTFAGGAQAVPVANIDRRATGLAIFTGPVSLADLISGTSTNRFLTRP
jgi:hypothetical protein